MNQCPACGGALKWQYTHRKNNPSPIPSIMVRCATTPSHCIMFLNSPAWVSRVVAGEDALTLLAATSHRTDVVATKQTATPSQV